MNGRIIYVHCINCLHLTAVPSAIACCIPTYRCFVLPICYRFKGQQLPGFLPARVVSVLGQALHQGWVSNQQSNYVSFSRTSTKQPNLVMTDDFNRFLEPTHLCMSTVLGEPKSHLLADSKMRMLTVGKTSSTSEQRVTRPLPAQNSITQKEVFKHPCLELDSNPQSQYPRDQDPPL